MAMHTELSTYKASLGLLQMATNLTRNIPRDLKQSLGKRVIDECIDVLMLIARANATPDKRPHLTLLVEKVQVIEFLMRLFKESRFISVGQHDYGEMRVYVESQYYAWEFEAIKAAILDGTLTYTPKQAVNTHDLVTREAV